MAADNNPWDWDNENLTDLPLAYISRSVWDEWMQCEADAHTLFSSTPSSEVNQPQFSLQIEGGCSKSSLTGKIEPPSSSASCQTPVLSVDSPRSKRRRMLLFPGERDGSDDITFSSTSDSDYLHGISEGRNNCKYGRCDHKLPLHRESTLTSSLRSGCNDECVQRRQEEIYWSASLQNKLGAVSTPQAHPQMNAFVPPPVPICDDHDPAVKQAAAASIQTSNRESFSGEKSPVTRPIIRPKLAASVAYPFAVLKPSGVAGDVTLNDINKRILMPPKRPIQHPVGDYAKPPSAASTGSGLSGKAVVALTKIHTEGKGTITIMRTKG